MIKKLRKKIIAINVISVCIVFLVAMAFVFGTGYKRINDERIIRLNSLLEQEDWYNSDLIPADIAVAEYDESTKTVAWSSVGANVKFEEQDLNKVFEKVVQKSNSDGWLSLRVLYAKHTVDGVTRIAIYDRNSNSRGMVMYILYTLLTLCIGSLSYFVISYILARETLKSVEESWNKQKQFVADASHELKTPLSVIMANTELIASHGDETVNSQIQWIENTRLEAERMAGLVNDLLFLAKNDDGVKAQMQVVNLSECIETIVLSHEVLLYEAGKSFAYEISQNVQVVGNDGQLKQLATILLDNANKYSKGDGNILLKVTATGKLAVLTLTNDCEQISDEQLSHLFDRFYTVDQSRNSSGNGLGLSIAQAICQTHRGNIEAYYVDGRITFVATFPLYKSK